MNKKELLSLIRNKLVAGDTTAASKGLYHPVVIAKSVDLGYDEVLTEILTGSDKYGEFTLPGMDAMVKSVIKPVFYDEARGQHYLDFYITDKKFAKQFTLPKNPSTLFSIIDTVSEPVWDELEAGQLDYNIGVLLEIDRIYFDNNFPSKNPPPNILVKFIPTFDQLADTDEIKIPSMALYNATMKYWKDQRPNDDLNENKQMP